MGGYLSLKDTNIKPNELTKEKLSQENLVGVYIQSGEEYTRSDTIPDSGYMLNEEKSYCKIGDEVQHVTITYDGSTKMLSVSPITKEGTKCYLYFDEYQQLLIDVINEAYQNNTTTLAYDNTVDNNLRYIGENPDNYVYFNCDDYNNPSSSTCELWRIIGVMNNMETADGTTETLVKLIRNDSIGNNAWNDDDTNDWSTSSLQESLNNSYLQGTTFGSGKGITEATRDIIKEVTWHLGGKEELFGSAETFYNAERGTIVYGGNPTTWSGKVGLMYPSDFGYATNGGETTSREACLAMDLYNWTNSNDCYNNNWLYNNLNEWTITHRYIENNAIFNVYTFLNTISSGVPSINFNVRPSIYIKSNITVMSGNGSKNNPYILNI